MAIVAPKIKIGVIVPTRGRSRNVSRLRAAFLETRKMASSQIVWCVDQDDPEVKEVMRIVGDDKVLCGKRRSMAQWTNFACGLYRDDFTVFASWGDDHLPKTFGWDKEMAEVQTDEWPCITYGNDLYMGQRLPTAPFISEPIIRELGFMCPPGFQHMFVDNYWRELGKESHCLFYCPWVVIEHVHPQAGKTHWDTNYLRVARLTASDQQAAAHYESIGSLRRDIDKIKALRDIPF